MDWLPNRIFPEAFHQVALKVYAGDPNWIPESHADLAQNFSQQNPYFSRAQAWLDYIAQRARASPVFLPGFAH